MCKPDGAFFLSVFFPPPQPPPLFVLVDRDGKISALAVIEALSCFIITIRSLRSLLDPTFVTALDA